MKQKNDKKRYKKEGEKQCMVLCFTCAASSLLKKGKKRTNLLSTSTTSHGGKGLLFLSLLLRLRGLQYTHKNGKKR